MPLLTNTDFIEMMYQNELIENVVVNHRRNVLWCTYIHK